MNDCRSETALEPEQQEVDRRPVRMFNIKPLAPRTSAQAFAKAFDDDKHFVSRLSVAGKLALLGNTGKILN